MAILLFFARNSKLKIDFKIVLPRRKDLALSNFLFSHNTPPGFYLDKHTKSIVHVSKLSDTWQAPTPYKHPLNARLGGGRAEPILRNSETCQKIFVHFDEKKSTKNFTKPLDKRAPMCYNTDTKNRGTHLTK